MDANPIREASILHVMDVLQLMRIGGIPMGTSCAGFIANLYCFTYELDFMDRLINNSMFDTARKFLNVCRYIDDLLTIDIPDIDNYLYLDSGSNNIGIYPKSILSLELADDGLNVPYMDIYIRQNARRGLISSIYDKRLDSKYSSINVIRYPHVDSFIADTAKYGIVTSQLHRFASRCVLKQDFVYNVALVIYRMILKGYCTRKIWRQVYKFFNSFPYIYDHKDFRFWKKRILHILSLLFSYKITPGPCGPVRN